MEGALPHGSHAYLRRLIAIGGMALALVGLSTACSEDKKPSPSAAAGSPTQNEPERDAAIEDAGDQDSGGAILTGSDQVLCTYEESDLFSFDGDATGVAAGVAGDERGFAMVFRSSSGELYARAVPLRGSADDPVRIASAAEQLTAPLLAVSQGELLLGYRNQNDGRLFARSLAAEAPAPLVLSDQVGVGEDGASLSALAATGDGFVVAFVDATGALQLRRLSRAGQVLMTRTHADAFEQAPRDLHLGYFEDGHALLGWSTDTGDGDGEVLARALDSELSLRDGVMTLSASEVSQGRFGFAVRGSSAGLIYQALEGGVRDAIKFQRVERDGSMSGPLLNVINAPRRTRDGAIASFGQGYVVSHRVLTSRGEQRERVEVAFVNQFGSIVYRGTIGDTSAAGGATAVAATQDGHVLASWTTVARDGTATVHAAKLYCPGALILCGGELPGATEQE